MRISGSDTLFSPLMSCRSRELDPLFFFFLYLNFYGIPDASCVYGARVRCDKGNVVAIRRTLIEIRANVKTKVKYFRLREKIKSLGYAVDLPRA